MPIRHTKWSDKLFFMSYRNCSLFTVTAPAHVGTVYTLALCQIAWSTLLYTHLTLHYTLLPLLAATLLHHQNSRGNSPTENGEYGEYKGTEVIVIVPFYTVVLYISMIQDSSPGETT